MEREQFNNLREKLYDLQVSVDADIWSGIETSLRRRKRMRLFYWTSSVAAAVIAALFVFIPNPQKEKIPQKTATTEILESQVAPVAQVAPVVPVAAAGVHKSTDEVKAVEAAGIVDEATAEVPAEVAGKPAEEVAEKQDAVQEKRVSEEKQVYNLDDFEGYMAQAENNGKRYSIALTSGVIPGSQASVAGSVIRATSAGAGNISQSYMVEQISDTKYSLPLNLGVQFQFPLGSNMALGLGVNYTMLRSSYDCLINKKSFNIKQTLHYVGIPVNVYGLVVEKNNFSFYVNAGAALEKGIRAVYHLKSYDKSEHNSSSIDGIQLSANAGMGVEYRFNNTLGLYLEPNIVYYFNSDIPRSIRTDQPLQVKAELGFRFRF